MDNVLPTGISNQSVVCKQVKLKNGRTQKKLNLWKYHMWL